MSNLRRLKEDSNRLTTGGAGDFVQGGLEMTTQEAIAEIAKAQAERRKIELQDTEQHRWSIGVNCIGECFWKFDCGCFNFECDFCEYYTYKTLDEFVADQCLASNDWQWEEVGK